MSETPRPDKQWCDLREIILDAAEGKRSPLTDRYRDHSAVVKAMAYLADRSQEHLLNDAAREIASLKPGVNPQTARRVPWLVLDTS